MKSVIPLPKILVIEGAEGTGKTTLARQVQELYPHTSLLVHHGRGSSKVPIVQAEIQALSHLPKDFLVIMDRWWYSDYIYSYLENRPSEMGIPIDRAMELFDWVCTLRLLCEAPLRTRIERTAADDAPINKVEESAWYNALLGKWLRPPLAKEVVDVILRSV